MSRLNFKWINKLFIEKKNYNLSPNVREQDSSAAFSKTFL